MKVCIVIYFVYYYIILNNVLINIYFLEFIGFATEEQMLETYLVEQIQEPLHEFLAIVIDKKQESRYFKYKIRHSTQISSELYTDMTLSIPEHKYLKLVPFIQLQMCLDDSFIKNVANVSIMPKVIKYFVYL